MTYCSEALVETVGPKVKRAVTLKCRSWQCADCAKDRRKRLVAEGIGGKPNTFLTLTSRRIEGQSPAQAAIALSHAWRRIRRAAMREFKLKALPFLAVFEATKLGWPHLHILCRVAWLEQAWLSKQMEAATGSPVVYIERIKDGAKTAVYVAKYVGKSPHRFEGTKRYWQSKDYDLTQWTDEREKLSWQRRRMSVEEWMQEARVSGWFAFRKSHTEAYALRPG